MLTNRTCAALWLAAGLGAASFAPAANAQVPDCKTFGNEALRQQKDHETYKCGLTDPEWRRNRDEHIAWCGSVGPEQWQTELRQREKKLAACKAGK